MVGWILAALAIVAALLVLPPLLNALPRSRKGGVQFGPSLAELNALFNPAERQVEIARRQLPAERENDAPKD